MPTFADRLVVAVPLLEALLLAALCQIHHQKDHLVLRSEGFPAEVSTLSVNQVNRSVTFSDSISTA